MSLTNKIQSKIQMSCQVIRKALFVFINGTKKTHTSVEVLDQMSTEVPRSINEPILVYQMGRVGSQSITASLNHYYHTSSKHIVHGHYLNSFDELEARAKADLVDTTSFMTDLNLVNRRIREAIQDVPQGKKIKIISLVRDPVARNVSTFFYVLDQFIPDWEMKFSQGLLSINDLHSVFLSKRSFVLSAFNWFDEQMKPVFDIDVYAVPFPREKGYKIYSSNKAELLLLRLESLSQCSREAFSEFLGIEHFELVKVNAGAERKAGGLYKLFTNKPLSSEYVQWTYSTKLARHFYDEAELKAFMQSWTG